VTVLHPPSSRREAMDQARQSRRPSRLGAAAGAAPGPDHQRDPDAGFLALLNTIWRGTTRAPAHEAVETALTLGGHVPREVSLRALATRAACAVEALWGAGWRLSDHRCQPLTSDGPVAFAGEIGLGTDGRLRIRTPADPPLSGTALVGRPRAVSWPAGALVRYTEALNLAQDRNARALADCRTWLEHLGDAERDAQLERLREATLRTAPVVLYQEGQPYTNFRDRNTIVGKTLWPGHPDCVFSRLKGMPVHLWCDEDVLLVVCLLLLIRSGGAGRIEEANGTELNLDNVAHVLHRIRRDYDAVGAGPPLRPAQTVTVAALHDLAGRLAEARDRVIRERQLYREIHGVLLNKVERVAARTGADVEWRERALVDRLTHRLPMVGRCLDHLGAALAVAPGWLTRPHGEFGTGLESLVFEAVTASTEVFGADFAMSRGMRDLTALVTAMRRADWATIVGWELPDYFCCVVPSAQAERHFPGGVTQVADVAWAMSSRMQYNSWHFVPGNLPEAAARCRRDFFIPPTMPDLAYFSDQHHHGHVTARVRFTVRSPQAVAILGRTFKGFIDLRLLRCDGEPFVEADLLAAHRLSGLIAQATGHVAELATTGVPARVTAFDSRWHWTTILTRAAAAVTGGVR
jgi:hypothetical protein